MSTTVTSSSKVVDFGGYIKAIVPKDFNTVPLDVERFRADLLNELRAVARVHITDQYRRTVGSWKSPKPLFKVYQARLTRDGAMSIIGGLSDAARNENVKKGNRISLSDLYAIIDRGTGTRSFRAKYADLSKTEFMQLQLAMGGDLDGSRELAWNSPWSAQTQPGVIGSRQSSVGETIYRTTRTVYNKVEPRDFTGTIKNKLDRVFPDLMRKSVAKAVNKQYGR